MPGIPPRMPPNLHKSRFDKWVHGWLLGQQGLSGAGKQFVQSIDPRSPQGLLNAMAMMVPGKGSGENALAAHLGHSEFRPYSNPGYNHEGLLTPGDLRNHGGGMPHGGDIGYHHGGQSMGAFKAIHGYSLPELLGLVTSKRIADRELLRKMGPGGFLHAPYRSDRGLNN